MIKCMYINSTIARYWNQPVLSNEGNVSSLREQLIEFWTQSWHVSIENNISFLIRGRIRKQKLRIVKMYVYCLFNVFNEMV